MLIYTYIMVYLSSVWWMRYDGLGFHKLYLRTKILGSPPLPLSELLFIQLYIPKSLQATDKHDKQTWSIINRF